MKLNDALNINEAGTVPPTQLSPTQDLNYQLRYWDGDRPEYDQKDKFINNKAKKRKKGKVKKVGLMVTKVEYDDDEKKEENNTKTRDVPPNYLNMSLSPFFMRADDEEEYQPKKKFVTKQKKKKKKSKTQAE